MIPPAGPTSLEEDLQRLRIPLTRDFGRANPFLCSDSEPMMFRLEVEVRLGQ